MTEQKKFVAQILAGDRNAFRLLIDRYRRLVSHIVFRMIPAGPDREDMCQEIFVKVYQNLSRFRFDAKLSTWIARIAYNNCLNFLEKKKLSLYDDLGDEEKPYDPVAPEEESRPDRQYENANTGELVRVEINRLPPAYRTIITLFHLEHMSYIDIADIMDLPEGTVKSHLFRARQILKKRLETKFQREEL
jgi:RNA polymerase sigma-70 factor (ECF subfamily)